MTAILHAARCPPIALSSSHELTLTCFAWRRKSRHIRDPVKTPLYQAHLHAAAHGHRRVGLGTEGSIREAPPLSPAPTVWFGNAVERI